jgi:hypothetical protein
MDQSRRHTLTACIASLAAFAIHPAAFAQDQEPGIPTGAPRREQNRPEDSGLPPAAGTKAILEQRQKDIKKDVEKLFDLASELKTQVEKIDSTTVLSLAMMKKTEEIEKLAKQIRDRAKG